jgi:hypothetical protein
MRRHNEIAKADDRKLMEPTFSQSVGQMSAELGTHVVTHYNWMEAWRLQGEVV